MTKIFQQKPSSQAASGTSRIAHASQGLADIDLAGIVGGAEQGELQLGSGIPAGVANTLPFSSGLQQLPVGALDSNSVPWAELTPAVKKLAGAGRVVPVPQHRLA